MKKISLIALCLSLPVMSCVSVATVDRYAQEGNKDALHSIMVNEKNDAAIRRAATVKLGKFREDSARTYLAEIIKGNSLGKEDRSPQAKKEQQVLAIKLLASYGAANADVIMQALNEVTPLSTRAELAVQVTTDLGLPYNMYIYEMVKNDEMPAEQSQMIMNYLAPFADNNIRMCYYYYDVVNYLAHNTDLGKQEVASNSVSILPSCANRHFEQKAWQTDPTFVAEYDAAQSAWIPVDEKLKSGMSITMDDARPVIDHLNAALKIDAANPLARYSMARVYQSLEMNVEALEWINSVFPTAPDWGIAYGLLCDIQYKLKKMSLATAACKTAIEKAPNVAWHYYLQGYVYKKRGKYQEALNSFTYASSIDQKTYGPLLQKELEYLRKLLGVSTSN